MGPIPGALNELGGGLYGIDVPLSSTPGQVAQKGDSWAKLARQQYGDERYALALAQANGANSTLLRAGDSVYFPDLSGADLKQGGQLIAADTQARAQRQAAAAQQATSANQSAEPVWSFKEASMAQRKLDDAAAASAGRKIYEAGLANAPSASQWSGKSSDPYEQGRANLGMALIAPQVAAATTLMPMAIGTKLGLSVTGWAAFSGAVAGGSDAVGQYVMSDTGTIRPGQTAMATVLGAVSGPIGMRLGATGNVVLGAAGSAANTAFQNAYYGDTNSVAWSAAVGGTFAFGGYKLGDQMQSMFPAYRGPTAALLQSKSNFGYILGNVTGSLVQTPSVFVPPVPNKYVP